MRVSDGAGGPGSSYGPPDDLALRPRTAEEGWRRGRDRLAVMNMTSHHVRGGYRRIQRRRPPTSNLSPQHRVYGLRTNRPAAMPPRKGLLCR